MRDSRGWNRPAGVGSVSSPWWRENISTSASLSTKQDKQCLLYLVYCFTVTLHRCVIRYGMVGPFWWRRWWPKKHNYHARKVRRLYGLLLLDLRTRLNPRSTLTDKRGQTGDGWHARARNDLSAGRWKIVGEGTMFITMRPLRRVVRSIVRGAFALARGSINVANEDIIAGFDCWVFV